MPDSAPRGKPGGRLDPDEIKDVIKQHAGLFRYRLLHTHSLQWIPDSAGGWEMLK